MIWFILILIVLLLAAILITLLKAWNWIAIVIGVIVVWMVLAAGLGHLFGDIGTKVGIVGPFAVIVVGAILGWTMDIGDKFKSRRSQNTARTDAARRRAALTAMRNENRRAAEKEKRKK